MVDPRIYRLAFAPALVALVVLMFSVEPIPEPVRAPETFAADFDGRRATTTARRIAEETPGRAPGSDGDAATADEVAERFTSVEAGKVTEAEFDGTFDGEDVELRNVMLTLPGNSSRTIVVVAGRDSPTEPGAASSAAATGLLLEMADELGRTSHEKTIVLLSAGGLSEGATGMREFLEAFPTLEEVDGVVALARPGSSDGAPPHLLTWSSGPESTSAQLVETGKLALAEETELAPGQGGFLGGLFRLALPAGLGPEAVAIEAGVDAIGFSGAGERSLPPSEDDVESLDEDAMATLGNTAMALVLALDTSGELTHGPGEHLTLAGNLIPGWALALLTLTLIVPALAACVDGMARAARRREPALGSLLWALSRALPFLAALLAAYLLALVGIAPDPRFPFDPGIYEFGWRAAGVLVAITAVFAAVAVLVRPLSRPPKPLRETLATALGVVASVALVGIWLVNPYLALLCVPLGHLWLLGARPATAASIAGTLLGIVVSLVPLVAATAHLADRLGLGAETPWTLVLLVTGGQIGFLEAVLGCLVAGSVLGLLALAMPVRRGRLDDENPLPARNQRVPAASR
jgi:MFS family permease